MLKIRPERWASYQIGFEKGLEIAKAEAAHEYSIEVAAKLLAEGKEPTWVAKVTDLPQAEIEQLQIEIKSGTYSPLPLGDG